MAKEMILTNNDCKMFTPLASGFVSRIYSLLDAGNTEELVTFRNENMATVRELQECAARCEAFAKMAKTFLKHTFNVGDAEELPNGVSWDKESYSYATDAADVIANDLVERGMASVDSFLKQLTVTQIAKAAGMTAEGVVEKYADAIQKKAKERVLRIK